MNEQLSMAPWAMKKDTGANLATDMAATRTLGDMVRHLMGQVEQRSSFEQAFLRGEEGQFTGGASLKSAYDQVAWVYSCVGKLASSVADVPFLISRGERGSENLVTQGDAVQLWRKPAPRMTRFGFWEMYVTWLMLRGEVFLVPLDRNGGIVDLDLVGGRGGRVARLIFLDPARVREVVDGNELVGWDYNAGHTDPYPSFQFLPSELLHDKIPNPWNFWRGMSPLAVATLASEVDFASAMYMRGVMLNNADAGLIISTDQQLAPEQREQFAAMLRKRKRKAGTADLPMFMWGGAKVEKPTFSGADLQLLEHRKFNRQEICAIFGVPQELLGFTEDANRSVTETTHLHFIQTRIAGLCERIEAAVEPAVMSHDASLVGWFDVESLPAMQAARRSRADTAVKYFGMGFAPNEINEVLDLGFKPVPWGNTGYLPFGLRPTTGAGEPPEAEASPGDSEEDEEDPMDKALRLLTAPPVPKADLPIQRNARLEAQADAYEASIAGSVAAKTGKLRRVFLDQRLRVLRQIEKITESLTAAGVTKAVDQVFDLDAENRDLLATINPLLVADLEFGGLQLWRELDLGDFDLAPVHATSYLRIRENRITGINQETFEALTDTLTEGLDAGESFKELRERVKKIFNEAGNVRAERIALTETNTAVNSGRFIGMKEAKVELKAWLPSNLEHSRASHQQAGRDYAAGIPVDEPFRVGGEALMHPGDPAGSPGNVINCKCHLIAVFADDRAGRGQKKGTSNKPLLDWKEFSRLRGEREPGKTP